MPETAAAATTSSSLETPLAHAAAVAVPDANDLAGRFLLAPNPEAASEAERVQALTDLHFGSVFTDHMARK